MSPPKQGAQNGNILSPTANMDTVSVHIHPPENNNHKIQKIILPPRTDAPIYYGRSSERPSQFLTRVEEYAETVHMWSEDTLLRGISQFLKGTALEWYCQLRSCHSLPRTWSDFKQTFMGQFNSPLRMAQQWQQWKQCKQHSEETINEFMIRLRPLWIEHFPQETEKDLIKHLFCKMRPDVLNLMGCPGNASLQEILLEAQRVEEILCYRAKVHNEDSKWSQFNHYNNDVSMSKNNNDGNRINNYSQNYQHSQNNTNALTSSQQNQRNLPNRQKSWCQHCGKSNHNSCECWYQNGNNTNNHSTNYDTNADNNSNNSTSVSKKRVRSLGQMGRPDSAKRAPYRTRLKTKVYSIQSQNVNSLIIQGIIGDVPTPMLIDTGSSMTLINSYLLSKLSPGLIKLLQPPPQIHLQLADGSPLYIKHILQLSITIDNVTQQYSTYIVPRLGRNCIIGNNFIKDTKLHIDGGNQCVYYATHEIKKTNNPPNNTESKEITDSTKLRHRIQIKENTQPINVGPYRCAPVRRKIIEDNIDEMLNEGIIRPSNRTWASPIVLAPKKDGTLRFCVDYRKLNAVTIRDAYPIPRIDDTLDALEEAQFISTLDLRSGYWQVQMEPASQALTAFSSRDWILSTILGTCRTFYLENDEYTVHFW
ncbi:unnamed protein product [Adineta ricciae]|uniref:Uncharacterized protein n=1 Tax=Adineta ricciae TaxID=249248 RepID=A0A815RCD0_ADIRI|nr:unnamed protein product [Adineta ricciae]CAF1656550.1 unnamed protein product [Adineta ricciae]